MSGLHFYNTASRSIEPFSPKEPGVVRMYCCGPTVYNYAHIGNLRTYVFEDFLRRALEYAGYQVKHVVNITDVGHLTSDADTGEDKLEKGAKREGRSVWDIARTYTEHFWKDWEALKLLAPTQWPKATDHIAEQIDLVRELERKGHTYRAGDGIYFDTSTFPDYAKFAGLDMENQSAGKRVAMVEGKRNASDFSLWKFSPTDAKRAMEWDSPWGVGFPGWHIECSAMAMKHLGETLDIHCGGSDHIRVHHTNEIAQSNCATGKPFARFWIHGGWLLEQGDDGSEGKMSKSNDAFVRLQTIIDRGFDPMDYRYFCMSSHYRNYLSFSWDNLDGARRGRAGLMQKVIPLVQVAGHASTPEAAEWKKRFWQSVCDDLNIPEALSIVYLMLKDSALLPTEKGALLLDFDRILGLDFQNIAEAQRTEELPADLLAMIPERAKARAEKNFKRSDEIRDAFLARGYVLKDSPAGTTWEKKV